MAKTESIDVVFSFDTTGSMTPCIAEVRRSVTQTVKQLFKDIPELRIGIVAHGDYCDAPPRGPYVIKMLDLTNNEKEIVKFVNNVESTYGGDFPECYELVLHEARRLTWSAGKQKVLVMIGDATPHKPHYSLNEKNLDWKNELALLHEAGVHVYGVQALNYRDSDSFWKGLSKSSAGLHLRLNQFRHVVDMIKAICYKQVSDKKLVEYRDLVQSQGRMNRDMAQIFGALTGSKVKVDYKMKAGLTSVDPGRFQIFDVDDDTPINSFVKSMGITFQTGKGFYEFTKTVNVQGYKEVILEHKRSGDLFTGKQARKMIGLPYGTTGRINPKDASLKDYNVFIQSTSNNRKLIAGTRFLYEVDGWASAVAA